MHEIGFYVNLPIGAVVALLLVFIDIPEQVSKPSITSQTASKTSTGTSPFHKLDLIGFVLFAPAAIQLLLALDYGAHVYGWKTPIPIGLFIGSGATFILFLLWERHQRDDAMMPLGIIRKRIVWSSCVTQLSIFCMTLAASYYLPVYFQAINDVSPMMSGVYLLPLILSQLLLAVVSGAWANHLLVPTMPSHEYQY
jgi:hypothetical protein